MIEYRFITKRELVDWQEKRASVGRERADSTNERIPRSGLQRGADSLSRIDCNQDLEPDAIRAIVAFDEQRIAGRLLIVYSDLLVNGALQRFAVGEDFFVLEEYRNRAVGLSLLLKAFKLGFPFIESGVSGQMKAILDSWKQFVPVDSSPMFQVGLDRTGLVQLAKWDLYEAHASGASRGEAWTKAALLSRHWRQQRRLARGSRERLQVFAVADAARGFERCLGSARAAVQLPWNTAVLNKALAGADPNCGAWFVESPTGSAGPWLLTLYRQERVLGQAADGTARSIKEAHLNEIYPPLDGAAPVETLLAFAFDRARAMGASVMQIHAMTPALAGACRRLGLGSRMTKSIYVAANGVYGTAAKQIADSASWWCRAFNENQFEEAFVGRAVEGRGSGLLC